MKLRLAFCFAFLNAAIINYAASRPVLVYQPPIRSWTSASTSKNSYIGDDCGYNKGDPCIVLNATESGSPKFTSPPISDDPIPTNETFMFSLLFKCSSSSLRPIMGVDRSEYEHVSYIKVNETARDNGWTEGSVLMRVSEKSNRKMFVSLYKTDGYCMFDQMKLTRVDIVEVTEDPEYGALGFGETIKTDGSFVSKIFTDNFLGAYSPRLTSFTSQWRSRTLAMNANTNATFDYSKFKQEFKTPLYVKTYVSYKYRSTALVLSKSKDGINWVDVSTLNEGWTNLSLGSTDYKYFNIRMPMGNESSVMQIRTITVESTVKPRVKGDLHGRHVIFVPTNEDSEKGVSASFTKDESTEDSIQLTIKTNNESADVAFNYSFYGFTKPSFELDKESGSVSADKEFTTNIIATLSSSDNIVGDYSVYDTKSGASFCSGYMITSQLNPLDDVSYGETLGDNSEPNEGTLWWCGSTYKVSKGRRAPKQKGNNIQIYAAKNEYEPFQLVFKAGDKDKVITGVTLDKLVSLDNKDAVISNITIRRVMHLRTAQKTDDAYGRDGEYWPDPLVPCSFPYTCPAGENCVFWVLVYVPANATQGAYEGTVSLTLDGGRALEGKVSLTVWNFTIPKKTKLRSLLAYKPAMLNAYHHIKDANISVKHDVYYKYYDSYSKHRINPTSAFYLYSPNARIEKDGEYHVDFTRFKSHVDELYSEDGFGFTSDVM